MMLARMVGYFMPLQTATKLYIVESPMMMASFLPTVTGAVAVVEKVAV